MKNFDGIRTSKTVGSTTTEYFLNGSQIFAQKTGSTTMPFYYDANGTRIAFKYNGTMYYYVYNLQGDVTHIIDSTGAIKGTYQYDAWGKILNINNLTAIAQANPFRYRGYYYDTESGLYYLNSRYYNAEWGRFINADNAIADVGGDIRGYNLFAYCMNNPVNLTDETGNWPKWVETAAKVASVVVAVAATVVMVATVSAVSAGTLAPGAIFGASVFLGAALSGINGGVANEAKGNSYANGYLGGATGGVIQSVCSKTPAGVIVGGGVGVTVGTAVTDVMNNLDPDSANSSASQILMNAITSGTKALATSSLTACVGTGVGGVNYKTGTIEGAVVDGFGGLMPTLTFGFGEGIKAFFGWADDAVVYLWE